MHTWKNHWKGQVFLKQKSRFFNFNNDNFEAIESLERWDFISKERPCWRDLFYLRRKSHIKNKHSSLFKKPRRIRSRNRKFRGIDWWRRDHSLSIYCLLRRKSFRRRWFVPWINLVIYWERLLGSSHNGFKIFCFIKRSFFLNLKRFSERIWRN